MIDSWPLCREENPSQVSGMCLENVMASFQEVLNGHVCEVRTLLPRGGGGGSGACSPGKCLKT